MVWSKSVQIKVSQSVLCTPSCLQYQSKIDIETFGVSFGTNCFEFNKGVLCRSDG